jgi:hypothetical protein
MELTEKIEGGLIGVVVGVVFGLVVGGAVAWKYQANSYTAKISQMQATADKEIANANAATINIQNRYASLEQTNEKLTQDRTTALAKVTAATTSTVQSRGLFVHASCPVGSKVPSSTSSTSTVANTATSIRLSDPDAEFLRSQFQSADDTAVYAQAGHDYAELIEQWIKDQEGMTNK